MAEFKSERELLADISAKLDRLIAVTAIAGREAAEHPELLIGLGLDAKVVAELTGLTINAITIRKSRMKQQKPAASKAKKNKGK